MMFSSLSSEALQKKIRVETMLAPDNDAPQPLLDALARWHIPAMSLAIINDYRIERAEGYGVRAMGQPERIDTSTLFQACSMSKAVTAIAALRLVEQGKLELDADINTFLTSWKLPRHGAWQPHVTLRQLLSHTAGVSVAWYPGYHRDQDIPTLLEILEGDQPSNTPGVRVTSLPGLRFRYAGGGFCIVQQALMDVMQQPFPDLMRELIFTPLGMQHSTYEQPLPPEQWQSAATAHRASGKPVAGQWHIYPEMAAAGLWTTPSDMALLALDLQLTKAGRPGQLLSPQMINALLTPQSSAGQRGNIGLGMFLQGTGSASARFGHAGDNTGFHCQWVSLVERGQGFVIMTNSDAGWRMIEQMERIIPRVYEWPTIRPVKKPRRIQRTSNEDEFVGEYALRPDFLLSVQKQGRRLHLCVPQQAPLPLKRVDELVYQLEDLEDTVTFVRNVRGEIDMLILRQEEGQFVARRRSDVAASK